MIRTGQQYLDSIRDNREVMHTRIRKFNTRTTYPEQNLGDAAAQAEPVHSAGLLVVHEVSWPIIDLRIDWSDHDPIGVPGNL
jgi:hypothetical protein